MPDNTPSTPIPAATIIIGRNSSSGPEYFMVLRHKEIDFASGALVFPGGKVCDGDNNKNIRSYCEGVDSLDDTELGFRVAAIRESFEESGILLAKKRGGKNLLSANELASLDHYRKPLNEEKISIGVFLEKEDLVLACNNLVLFAHWITPEMMPKRFDTRFYVAAAPVGQIGVHDGKESVDSKWLTAEQIINDEKTGKYNVIFPTRMNILKLKKNKTIEDLLYKANSEKIITVLPKLKEGKSGLVLCIPEEAGYDITEEPIENILKTHK